MENGSHGAAYCLSVCSFQELGGYNTASRGRRQSSECLHQPAASSVPDRREVVVLPVCSFQRFPHRALANCGIPRLSARCCSSRRRLASEQCGSCEPGSEVGRHEQHRIRMGSSRRRRARQMPRSRRPAISSLVTGLGTLSRLHQARVAVPLKLDRRETERGSGKRRGVTVQQTRGAHPETSPQEYDRTGSQSREWRCLSHLPSPDRG